MKFTKLISTLTKLALFADRSIMLCRHAAVVIKNGTPIASGINCVRGRESYHAELDAIRSTLLIQNRGFKTKRGVPVNKKINRSLTGAVLVVIRWNGQRFTESKPCYECLSCIKLVGIKRVLFSNSNGDVESHRTSCLSSLHHSVARRAGL